MKSRWMEDIETVSGINELIVIKKQCLERLQSELERDWLPYQRIVEANRFHRCLFQRVLQISIEEMKTQRHDLPSTPFCFVLFGSGGRGEISPRSDQDHGIIYAHEQPAEEAVDAKYQSLFEKVTGYLEMLGYPLCEGNVLATNRRWRLSFGECKKMIDSWFEDMSWENVRYLTIFADIDRLFGDHGPIDHLRQYLFQKISEKPVMIERLYENAKGKPVPLGLFGRILTERYGEAAGAISVKQGMYLPVVKLIRIFALGEGIYSPSTYERIVWLVKKGVWSYEYGQQMQQLLLKILTFRHGCPKRFPVKSCEYLDVSKLAKEEVEELRAMLKQIKELQTLTEHYVKRKRG